MRQIESHKTNDCNKAITIEADERDPDNGNTSHNYSLRWNLERDGKPFEGDQLIQFQHGPIQEVGVNGVTNEALLALLITIAVPTDRVALLEKEAAKAADHERRWSVRTEEREVHRRDREGDLDRARRRQGVGTAERRACRQRGLRQGAQG